MRRLMLAFSVFAAPAAACAQADNHYKAFRSLVDTFPSTRLQGDHYVITGEGGTGLADITGAILIPPRFEMMTFNDHVEFRSPDASVLTDRRLNILQQGPYERYWRLDGAGTLYYVFTRDRSRGSCPHEPLYLC